MKVFSVLFFIMLVSSISFAASSVLDEQPTRTLYFNKVPYDAFFYSNKVKNIDVQVGNRQAVIPVSKTNLTKEKN